MKLKLSLNIFVKLGEFSSSTTIWSRNTDSRVSVCCALYFYFILLINDFTINIPSTHHLFKGLCRRLAVQRTRVFTPGTVHSFENKKLLNNRSVIGKL
jgi:hypothetical protein